MKSRHGIQPEITASSRIAEGGEYVAALEAENQALRARLAEIERHRVSDACLAAGLDPALIAQVIDSVDTLVVIVDEEGRVVLFNRACQEIYGRSEDSVRGQRIWELFRKAGFEDEARRAFEQLLSGGMSPDLERYAIQRGAEKHYIQWSSRVLQAEGHPRYVIITGLDVSRRRLAERALRSQIQFEKLIAGLSRKLISLSAENLEAELVENLRGLAELSRSDACALWLFMEDGRGILRHRLRLSDDSKSIERTEFKVEDLPSLVARIMQQELVIADDAASLPPTEATILALNGTNPPGAYLAAPLTSNSGVIGWFSLVSKQARPWREEIGSLAKVVAELLSGAIERVRAEDAVRNSEARFRTIIQNMPVMLCALEAEPDFSVSPANLNFVAWNAECERVSGYSADEIVNNPRHFDLLSPSPEYYANMSKEWESLGNDFRDTHWLLRTKSGEMRMVAWSNISGETPIPGWGSWGVGIDVTKQYEAQQALEKARQELEERVVERTRELTEANKQLVRQIESREDVENALRYQTRILRAILNSIFDGIAVADEHGQFILFNKAAERILQLPAIDTGYQKWPSSYGLYLPDQKNLYPAEQLPLVRAIHGEVVEAAEIYLKRDDGPQGVWLSVNACPLEDDRGDLTGGVAIFRDITEMKVAQQQLEAEQRVLQQLLRAHERDRQLLAYEIHDGLVQDVTGALMHLESYDSRRESKPTNAELEFQLSLRIMRRVIDEARRVISGLRPPILDEQGIVAAIEYLISEHRQRGPIEIDFHSQISGQPFEPLLEGTIYRILQEALSNVYKHSQASRAEVALVELADVVQIQVLDNGIGFDPKQVTPNRYGLEGIRERARLLRGAARIESSPGHGTRVYVELPVTHRNVREGSLHEHSSIDR